MYSILAFVLVAFALVSGQKEELNCRCSVVIAGDNQIFVNYESSNMAHAHNCDDVDGCKDKCVGMMTNVTNGGDLSSKPAELHGASIGDYGCRLIGLDIDRGIVTVHARVCQKQVVKTDFKFKGDLCCRGKVHYENCPEKQN